MTKKTNNSVVKIDATSFSLSAVSAKIAEICSNPSFLAALAKKV